MTIYHNNFGCWKDVVNEFTGSNYHEDKQKENQINGLYDKPEQVFYANYDIDGYDGSAAVLWYDKGKYNILVGSHCSCYGLEDTGFSPEVFETKELFLKFLEQAYVYTLRDDKEKSRLIKKISKFVPKS